MIGRWLAWARTSDDVRRVLVLLVVTVVTSLLVVNFTRVPTEDLEVGDVAPRTIEAPHDFRYVDMAERERQQEAARLGSPWVYVYRADLAGDITARVTHAFEQGRADIERALAFHGLERADQLSWVPADVVTAFRTNLGTHVPDETVEPLLLAGFPVAAERLVIDLLSRAMRGYVIVDPQLLPSESSPIAVIEVRGDQRTEILVTNHDLVGTPDDARDRISLGLLETDVAPAPWVDAAARVARASVRQNLVYDHLQTAERQEAAAASVPLESVPVKRGTTLFTRGQPLTELDLLRYHELQKSLGPYGLGFRLAAVQLFLLLLLTALYQFGATFLPGFTGRVRDVAAAGVLLVFTAVMARLVVTAAPSLATLLGADTDPASLWFVVPVAGCVILVRLLIGVGWSALFAIAAAAVCGLVMRLDAVYVVYFMLSGLTAAGLVEHTRERLAVLRAGAVTGLVNAAVVFPIHFLTLFEASDGLAMATELGAFWAMVFAFAGGVFAAFLVLGLMPVFEAAGFVTDYRMLELASLNHPLLRNLMLKAPGSYHHSVIVGSLAEAACEAIGANALQARVAAYFHDIGKAIKPQYFVENQKGGVNRHDRLDPYTSARVIINHVTDGARMAREHNLPKPIVDNILMHHGDGTLAYFLDQARKQADDPDQVDVSAFRYPGPKPNTREAGVVMLADKVEAATRTIKNPTEPAFRAMIEKITNSVIADGQFERCPLTFQEVYTIAEVFVKVLNGIYHHRIEYDATRDISSNQGATDTSRPSALSFPPPRPGAVITLEVPSSEVRARTGTDDHLGNLGDVDESTDWESVDHLPRGH